MALDRFHLHNVTVISYGRNFYYHSVTKTTEIKPTGISNVFSCRTAFCSEAQKWIQVKRLRLQSLSNQTLKRKTTKVFLIALKVAMKFNSAFTASASTHLAAIRLPCKYGPKASLLS